MTETTPSKENKMTKTTDKRISEIHEGRRLQEIAPQLDDLIRMIDTAQKKLTAYGPGWTLRPKLSATFNLALMGWTLGTDGTIDFVTKYFQVTGCIDLPAASLNLPRKFVHACVKREMSNRGPRTAQDKITLH
jgi:hypothetical protein